MNESRTILQQGELDGFCLLYAVLNAFSAVYPKKIELSQQQELWSRLISVTPSLQEFASSGSTFRELPNNEIDIAIKRSLLGQYGSVLSDWLKSEAQSSMSQISIEPISADTPTWYRALLSEPFSPRKAFIVCLKRRKKRPTLKYGPTNEHWIAVVGKTDKGLAVACSFTSHHLAESYRESEIIVGKQPRAFNNLIVEPLTCDHVYVGSRYQLIIS